jgi:GTP-binding protein
MSTVVIVGRKNVGKSTIFNRLTGMRLSVVYKEPGITRDRVYGEVEWRGTTFNIIDTGGFFPDEEHTLAHQINKQIDRGVHEADLIYLVVDGKEGLTPIDETICQHMRKSNKPIFLLINKTDSKESKRNLPEFAQLGIADSFEVAAEPGIGFGSVLDKTMELLPSERKRKKEKIAKILILGRPNAGKSTLLNAKTDSERAIVDEQPGTTRDVLNAQFRYDGTNMEVIDTSGLRRRTRIMSSVEFYSMVHTIRMIDRADIVILLFDTTQGVVDQDRRIAAMVLSKAKSLIVAPNKIDLISKTNRKKIIPSTYASFAFLDFVPVVPLSAKNRNGIETLLRHILSTVQESKKVVDKKTLTMLTAQLQSPTGGHLLHIRQIKTQPLMFRATVTTRVKESYVKYLRNMLRNYFGFRGVPILIKTRVVKRRRQ